MNTITETMRLAGIALNDGAGERLEVYHALLCEWNQKIDLTNVPEEEMPLRHYADSLLPLARFPALFPFGASLIDVGTGAGLPGIPLAIQRPDMFVTLLDSQQKRCDFLSEAVRRTELKNVRVLHLRAEDGGKNPGLREVFDIAVARAVAPLNVLLEYLLPFVRVGGRALALKGPGVYEEKARALLSSRALGGGEIHIDDLPLGEWTHTLASVPKNQKTPPQYPRKSGLPAKKPIGE